MIDTAVDEASDAAAQTIGERREPNAPGRQVWSYAAGITPAAVPISMFIVAGMCCGPRGLQLLSEPLIAALDPLQSPALIALGALVGLSQPSTSGEARDVAARAGIRSLAAAITVALLAFAAVDLPVATRVLWIAFTAVCAGSASFTGWVFTGDADDRAQVERRAQVIADVAAIAIGSVAICVLHADSGRMAAGLLLETIVIGLMAASATALLVASTGIEAEQRVYVLGIVLLLAGAVDLLRLPAVGGGLLVGFSLRWARPVAREPVLRALTYCARPIVIWLLLVAGTRVTSLPVALAAAGVAVFAAAHLISRMAVERSGHGVTSAGLIGIALALDGLHLAHSSSAASIAMAVAVTGAIVADLTAFASRSGRRT